MSLQVAQPDPNFEELPAPDARDIPHLAVKPLHSDRIGSTLAGRFIVQARVGAGESGDFFTALDTGTGRARSTQLPVVIKIAHAAAHQPRARAAFGEEYNEARRLSHPNIARIHDLVTEGSACGYTLDLPPGASLAERFESQGDQVLSREYAWAVISATGAALVHAHSRHVIHGALSPRSLWLTDEHQLRLVEFGTRLIANEACDAHGAVSLAASALVERYASCEVLAGLEPRMSDDLYSVSCLAYELLCGVHPWGGASAPSARDGALPLVRPRRLTSRAWRTLKAGLSFTREKRPNSVREWLAALDLAVKDDRLPGMTVARPEKAFVPRKAALALAGGAVLGLGLWAWQSSHHGAREAKLVPESAPATLQTPTFDPAAPRSAAQILDPPVVPAAGQTATSSPQPKSIGAGLWFSAADYAPLPDSRFVEIQVLRRTSAAALGQFQWWTEAGTARAGTDFIAQAPALWTLQAGARRARLLIRVPGSKVSGRSFRVCVKPSADPAADAHVCAKISL
jgi:serine/threonine protein kinase